MGYLPDKEAQGSTGRELGASKGSEGLGRLGVLGQLRGVFGVWVRAVWSFRHGV